MHYIRQQTQYHLYCIPNFVCSYIINYCFLCSIIICHKVHCFTLFMISLLEPLYKYNTFTFMNTNVSKYFNLFCTLISNWLNSAVHQRHFGKFPARYIWELTNQIITVYLISHNVCLGDDQLQLHWSMQSSS